MTDYDYDTEIRQIPPTRDGKSWEGKVVRMIDENTAPETIPDTATLSHTREEATRKAIKELERFI